MFKIDGENLLISPPQELIIRAVGGFHGQLQEELGKENFKAILLDLVGVISIDTAGFQVIVAIKNEAKKRGLAFSIIGMSVEVEEIVSLYNAHHFFEG